MIRVAFTVLGHPQPAGSKRAFAVRKGGQPTGRIAVADANPKASSWKQDVAAAAIASNPPALDGPLGLVATFYLKRPKSHYGTGRNARRHKPSAPHYPTGAPDTTKLLRGVEDALQGVLYANDAQIVEQWAVKRYGTPERAEIVIYTIDPSPC